MSTTQTREKWLASLKRGDKVALQGRYTPDGYEYSTLVVERVTPTGRIWLVNGEQYRADGSRMRKMTGRATWGDPSYELVEPTPEILQSIDARIKKRNLRAQINTLLDYRAIDNLSVEGLEEVLAFVRPGDTVIVWKLDRLGRSLKDLIETLNLLKDQGVDFISLTEKIDTTTPGGKLIFHVMGALAEFERDLIRERTNAGLVAARARGRVGGRPKKLTTNGKVALARQLFADPNQSISEICSTLEISRSTLYRYVRDAKRTSKPSDPPA